MNCWKEHFNRIDDTSLDMDYYNADGSKSFCGNGSRCAVLFTLSLGLHKGKTIFNAIDGLHKASVSGDMVAIEMNDVNDIKFHQDDYLLDTGSPHYVVFNDDLSSEHTVLKGKEIRFSESSCWMWKYQIKWNQWLWFISDTQRYCIYFSISRESIEGHSKFL